MWRRFLGGRVAGALDALNEQFALDLDAEDLAELVRVYREHRPDIRPFAGAGQMLSRLRGRFGLALLTDGFLPAQRYKLEATGLGRFFDAVVFSEELGREAWKPSRAPFERVAERLGTPHAACAYVADNPAKDFLAGNELGWLTVRYRRCGQVHAHKDAPRGGEPQFTVRDPGELHAALVRR